MATQAMFDVSTIHATEALAAHLAKLLVPPLTLTFRGNLGAGKTTLIRAMLRALQITGAVKSPTFSLVESYLLQDGVSQFHHFDLYRIEEEEELEYIGFRDYFSTQTICCIEWPERALHALRLIDIAFSFIFNEEGRFLHASASSAAGETLLSFLIEVA